MIKHIQLNVNKSDTGKSLHDKISALGTINQNGDWIQVRIIDLLPEFPTTITLHIDSKNEIVGIGHRNKKVIDKENKRLAAEKKKNKQ
jgi:hypothetical protein